MARYVRRGAGLTERLVKVPDTPQEALAAFKAWDSQIPVAQPGDWMGDALHRANAERCRAILTEVGLQDTGACVADRQALEAAGSGEGSAAYIAAHWLAEYNSMRRSRERIDSGDTGEQTLNQLLWAAHEMGRLQEEMRWRPGVDPKTGVSRERLAVERRDQRRALAGASYARNAANAARQEDARASEAVAQRIADDYWRRHPGASKAQVAAHVADRWPADCGLPRPSKHTIRQRIKKS